MRGKALSTSMLLLAFLAVAVAPAAAQTPAPASPTAAVPAPAPTPPAATGGAAYGVVFQPTVPGVVAQIVNGVAYAPDQAPDQVKQAIWAANTIVGMPIASAAATSSASPTTPTTARAPCRSRCTARACWPSRATRRRSCATAPAAPGQWITVYTNPGHAFAVIAGLRLDTSAAGDPAGGSGPRWRPNLRSTRGYRARHPVGL